MNNIKCKRANFEVILSMQEDFCCTPKHNQKNWILNRALSETADDLTALNHLCKKFIEGSVRPEIKGAQWHAEKASYKNEKQLIIDNQQVMQAWEAPYMREMAEIVSKNKGDVLEIGFGMGISATFIQDFGVKSHTIIEYNDDVIKFYDEWRKQYPSENITLIKGKWQDVINKLPSFDGVFFDSYPTSEEEYVKYVIEDVTYARHFFEAAYDHLHKGGIFTYYSNEIDSVSRRHQREIFKHFSEITFKVCKPLFPPFDCNYWWADSMVVIKAVK